MTDNIESILVNGDAADVVSVNERSLQFGDGLFETMLVHNGEVVMLDAHLQRLQRDADRLAIAYPGNECLLQDIDSLLQHGNRSEGVIKIILTRGCSDRGYAFDDSIRGNRIARYSNIDAGSSSILSGELLSGELCLCKTHASVNPTLSGIKHLNRLENVLARNEFDAQQYMDGIMLDSRGYAIEGTMSNLFTIVGDTLLTPFLEQSGINGVMRQAVLDIAADEGITCEHAAIHPAQLADMDAMFITNSLIGMKAVTRVGDIRFHIADMLERIFSRLIKDCNTDGRITGQQGINQDGMNQGGMNPGSTNQDSANQQTR